MGTILLILLHVALGSTQTPDALRPHFVEETQARLPLSAPGCSDVAAADLDGDGHVDLICGYDTQPVRVLRNDGTGIFEDVTIDALPDAPSSAMALATPDVSGDGLADLVIANRQTGDATDRLYINDGSGRLESVDFPFDTGDTYAVVPIDADGDGSIDLFFADNEDGINNDTPSPDRFYQNNGNGDFIDASTQWLPPETGYSNCAVAADFDMNGRTDLFVGNYGPDQLLMNVGDRFASAGYRLPAADDRLTTGAQAIDIDLDGDQDLFLSTSPFGGLPGYVVLINDGAGWFEDESWRLSNTDPELAWNILSADLDIDGDPDAIAIRSYRGGLQDRYLENDATGRFLDLTHGGDGLPGTRDDVLPADLSQSISAIVTDVDGDLSPEIILADHEVGPRLLRSTTGTVASQLTVSPRRSVPGDLLQVTLALHDGRSIKAPIECEAVLLTDDTELLLHRTLLEPGPGTRMGHWWIRAPRPGIYTLRWETRDVDTGHTWRANTIFRIVSPGARPDRTKDRMD